MRRIIVFLTLFICYVAVAQQPLDTALIQRTTGIKGISNKGEYKITVPQNDLKVMVDSFRIIPAMGLSTWVGFTPSMKGVMVMGDIVLTENDLKPVQQEVIQQGLTITAIHNHFVRNHPNILYMHIGGEGPVGLISAKIKSILDRVQSSRGTNPSSAAVAAVENTIDTGKLNSILGYHGEMNKGVYKHTIGRPDVKLTEHGMPVTSFMGFNTWAAWQGSNDRAAVAGDFAMLESEVADVIAALVKNNIEVVAVHNHMTFEQPRIIFLHYWGVGPAEQLARGLKQALDQTSKGNMENKKMGKM